MKKLFGAYRVLSPVVGVLLTFNTFVVLPLKYLLEDGSDLQRLGEDLSILWVLHGWVYIAYVVVAFLIAREARWKVEFSVLVLLAGLVPLLIFWVERKAVDRLRAQYPELSRAGS